MQVCAAVEADWEGVTAIRSTDGAPKYSSSHTSAVGCGVISQITWIT